MSENALLAFLEARGEDWIRWTPETAAEPDLADAVASFEGVDVPAGRAAAEWLRERALANHGSTVTYLMVVGGRVEAFYAICSASVQMTMRHRKEVGAGPHPSQPASLIAWLSKARDSDVDGETILLHALGVAQAVLDLQGNKVVVLDPYDEATADLWAERHQFRKTKADEGVTRLWHPLEPAPES